MQPFGKSSDSSDQTSACPPGRTTQTEPVRSFQPPESVFEGRGFRCCADIAGTPSAGRLSLPVNGVFTQYFWWGHTGVDLAAPYGTGLVASDDGVVVATGWVPVGGLRVCVQHAEGLQTCYYHTSSVYVSPGQTVSRGQLIAAIGMTGVTTGPHVHWELKVNGVAVNPLAY